MLWSLLFLALVFCSGVICILFPIKIVFAIALWIKFLLGSNLHNPSLNPKLEEALSLIFENQDDYKWKFNSQLRLIKITGFLALFITVIGVCIVIYGNYAKIAGIRNLPFGNMHDDL